MAVALYNSKQVCEIIGIHPNYLRRWLLTKNGAKFSRVVKERERDYWNKREVERWLAGAEY